MGTWVRFNSVLFALILAGAGVIGSGPRVASADLVTFTAPNVQNVTSFTTSVTFAGSFDISGYDFELLLAPEAGATGTVTFASPASDMRSTSNYILTGSSNYSNNPLFSNSSTILAADTLVSGTENKTNITKNLLTIPVTISSGAQGKWDLTWVQGGITDVLDAGGNNVPNPAYTNGSITVPEPATLSLMALSGLGMFLARRRKTGQHC